MAGKSNKSSSPSSKTTKADTKPKARSRARSSPSKTNTGNTQPKKRRRSTATKKPTKADKAGTGTPDPTHILIVDNGGDSLKYGWMDATEPQRLPNVTARLKHQWTVLRGDELQGSVHNPNQMHFVTRSTERGVVTNLGNQVQVWKRMLERLGVAIPNMESEAARAFGWKVTRPTKKQQQQQQQQPTAVSEPPKIPAALVAVLLLVPPHCPRTVLDQMMYAWMEDFGVSHVGFATSQICATQPHPDYQSSCLVDLGWSATNIVPTFRGTTIVNEGQEGRSRCPIRRIPLGGRHLINIWKYYSSYRQWNLMDQEWILRDVFEKLGYVSLNFSQEIEQARQTPQGRRPFDRNFVLPDYQTTHRGHVELTEALKREAEILKRRQEQLQQQEEEEEDGDFEDTKMEDEEDDDEADEEDEKGDYEAGGIGGNDDEEENESGPEDKDSSKDKKRKRKRKRKRKHYGDDDTDDNDSDGDDNKDMLRQRLLRQKQEEERRRKELEAEQQVLTVSVERFTVPEVLFLPSDAGLPVEMAGLAHAIVQSIKACPKYLQPALFRSIQLTGGVAQLPNLLERLQRELRALAPAQFEVQVELGEKPIDQAWIGGRDWVRKHPHADWSVSREEWEAGQRRKAWMKLLVSKGGILV